MKKFVSYIIMCAILLCYAGAVSADEVKEIVIDTDVPVFQDLADGQTYSISRGGSKDIYIADLSPVDCILMKKGSGTALLGDTSFSGYTEIVKKQNLSCINYVKIASLSDAGTYMVYAIDKYGHDIAVRFTLTTSGSTSGGGSSSGGGGGGGGGGGAAVTIKKPYANTSENNTGGSVNPGDSLKLNTQTIGAKIYYTLDGTTPTKSSTLYTSGTIITLTEGQTLKAVAIKDGVSSEISVWSCMGAESRKAIVGDMLECEKHIAYITGYPNDKFLPDNNMTRAEVTTMFARLMKEKMDSAETYPSDFTDVDSEEWYAAYIGYMSKFNVISGYEDGTFRPNQPITRAEFVTIASRFAKSIENSECDFSDITKNYWAYNYIAFAANNGWIGGYEDKTFRAERPITRAEVVTIVNRMLVREADKAYAASNSEVLAMFTDVTTAHWAYYNVIEAANEHDYTIKDGNEIWSK